MKYFLLIFCVLSIKEAESDSTLWNALNYTSEDIEDAIDFANMTVDKLKRFEETIKDSVKLEPGTKEYDSYMMYEPDWTAIKRGRDALLAVKASAQLAYTICLKQDMDLSQCNYFLNIMTFENTSLSHICDHLIAQCTTEERLAPYRTIDGSCNRVKQRSKGASYTSYSRINILPVYSNSLDIPKRSFTKSELPRAKDVVKSLSKRKEKESLSVLTSMYAYWGVFMENDLSRFAAPVMVHFNDSFRCCDLDGYPLAPRFQHPSCFSVLETKGKVEAEGCLGYSRSLPALRPDCSMGHMEQMNQATHFLDLSQLYGDSDEKSAQLREFTGGRIKLMDTDGKNARVNQIYVLLSVFGREHNRVAKELEKLNPDWDDEILFQESRRIVIAEMQHITFNEWVREIIKGFKDFDTRNGFVPMVDPRVTNEFATAAAKSFQSLIPSKISMLDKNYKSIHSESLKNIVNHPKITKDNFDSILRGMTSDRMNKMGIYSALEDTVSIDIQRGRDHGLAGYTSYVFDCEHNGHYPLKTFKDMEKFIPHQDALKLSNVYKHVDDIDLIVGLLLESPDEQIFGPALLCIIQNQLLRIKSGDRYFYTNKYQPKPFGELQLSEIKKVTLARVVCDNSGVESMQRDVFRKIDERNRVVSCNGDAIPKMDLSAWREDREKYLV